MAKKKKWTREEQERKGFEMLMKYGRSPEQSFIDKVEMLIQMKKFKQAEEIAQAGLTKHPDSAKLHGLMAKTLMLQKKLDQAFEHIQRALVLDPNDPILYMDLSFYYLLKRDEKKSQEYLKKALGKDKGKHNEWIMLYAVNLNYFGRFDKAVEFLKTFLKKEPGSADAWVYMGRAYVNLKKVKQAEECFKQALALSSDSADALAGMAAVSFFRMNRKKTLEYAQDAWRLDRSSEEAADFVHKASNFWLFYLSFLYNPIQMLVNRSTWIERIGFDPERIEAFLVVYLFTIVGIIFLHLLSAGLNFIGLAWPATIVSWLLIPLYMFFGFMLITFFYEYGRRYKGLKKERYETVVGTIIILYLWYWLLYLLGWILLPLGIWLLEAIFMIVFYLFFFWLVILVVFLIRFASTPGEPEKKKKLKIPAEKKKPKRGEPIF